MFNAVQILHTAGGTGPEATRTEVFAHDDPLLTRQNQRIPWDIVFLNKQQYHNEYFYQNEKVPVDEKLLGKFLSNRKQSGPVIVPPYGHRFANDKNVIEQLFQATNEEINVRCPEDEELHYKNTVTPALQGYANSIDGVERRKSKMKPKKEEDEDHLKIKKHRKHKEEPKDMLKRLMNERIERQNTAKKLSVVHDENQRRKSRLVALTLEIIAKKEAAEEEEPIITKKKQETGTGLIKTKNVPRELAEELQRRVLAGEIPLPKTESEEIRLLAAIANQTTNAKFCMYTDPVCFYPNWVRYHYQKDQKLIGEHITKGMGVMDIQIDPEFEAKMAGIRSAVTAREAYASKRSSKPIQTLFEGVQDLHKNLKREEDMKKWEKERWLQEKKEMEETIMNLDESLIKARLKELEKEGLLDLKNMDINSKKIISELDLQGEHSKKEGINVDDFIKEFENEYLQDSYDKGDEFQGLQKSDLDLKINETDEEMEGFTLPSRDLNYRKFDIAAIIRKKLKKAKRAERKARALALALALSRDRSGLPRFIEPDLNYPPNQDQDIWCARRFKEILREHYFTTRGKKKQLPWHILILKRRLVAKKLTDLAW